MSCCGYSRSGPSLAACGPDSAPPEAAPPAFAHIEQGWGNRQEASSPQIAVVKDGFRFMLARSPRGEEREELFDANTDPLERRNVIEEHPEVAARMRALADDYFESRAAPWGVETPSIELDEMELNQLRALGYAIP